MSRLLAQLDQLETAAVRALAGHPSKTDMADRPLRWSHSYHEVLQVDDDPDTEKRLTLVADCGRGNVFRARHVSIHDPKSVLRLCRAHRDIVELLDVVATLARGLGVEETEGKEN